MGCQKIGKEEPTNINDSITQQIKEYVGKMADNDNFSGAILVAKNDTVLFKKAYGYAHLGLKVLNNIDTKFNYASIGKTFTAIAIFQLMEQGKLSLSDTVGKFLMDYPNDVIRDSVTVEQLLSHKSGVPNYFGKNTFLESSKDRYRTLDDLSVLYENEPMEATPGERYAYRNTNYILLGRIVERITGIPYDDYIEEHVLQAASMSNTGNFDTDHPIENAAEGYTLSDVYPNTFKINVHTFPVKGSPAGGGYTTLEDLHRFTLAIKNNTLLNEASTALLTTPFGQSGYGYGMQFVHTEDGHIYGHSGGHFGVGAEWRIYEKENYTIIVLSNRDTDQGFLETRFFIQRLISGTTPTIEKYFFTKKVVDTYLQNGFQETVELIETDKEKLSELDLTIKGYDFLKRGKHEQAIAIFKLGLKAFPDSFNIYDSLAEAYMKNGENDRAIINYEKSLQLNPENTNAKNMMKKISKKIGK